MRVIAGVHRGRRLLGPRGQAIRPTSDRVKEALFSILGERTTGARVLDLYAGTGSIGIEALSRGAAHVTFVEAERHSGWCSLTCNIAVLNHPRVSAPAKSVNFFAARSIGPIPTTSSSAIHPIN